MIEWALGPQHLGSEPAPGDRYLLTISADTAAEEAPPAERKCLRATAFLPAPAPETRIFVLMDGKVYSMPTPNSNPERLSGGDASLTVTRLLAFSRPPAARALLVAGKPQGAQSEQIWLLTLGTGTIASAGKVTDTKAFVSQEAFFKYYDAPRCKSGGKQCLVLSADGQASYVDVEAQAGSSPAPLRKLGKLSVVAAAWTPGDERTIYLLTPCQ
ncbi:MAG: hypothetical protein R3B70_36230 [Polyangiaceae bacterium]